MDQAGPPSSHLTGLSDAVDSNSSPFGAVDDPPRLMADWTSVEQTSQAPYPHPHHHHHQHHPHDVSSLGPAVSAAYAVPLPAGSMDFISTHPLAVHAGLPVDTSLMSQDAPGAALPWGWEGFQTDLMAFATHQGLPNNAFAQAGLVEGSPTDTYLEVRSLTSCSSDGGWAAVDYQSLESQAGAIFNPSEALRLRTYSDSSNSEATGYVRNSLEGFEELSHPLTSPTSDVQLDRGRFHHHPATCFSPSAVVDPVPIQSSSSSSSSTSPRRLHSAQPAHSPPSSRRPARKSPTAKATKPVIRRPSHPTRKEAEKRVGRRHGPLNPEQRKQAGEIRKLRACLRCKFLKKTVSVLFSSPPEDFHRPAALRMYAANLLSPSRQCDKGEPCAGCRPSHARLWQVPCTRIDIKDVAYFMKDWKADYERHVSLGFSVNNLVGFSAVERSIFITHGYGYALPITVREVHVRDDRCFVLDWVETIHETPQTFVMSTAQLSAGVDGISTTLLSEYLDKHVDGDFEAWVDEYFEGTWFLTEILKTASRFYRREKLPVIRKALKLVLAYNLTMHVTMVEGLTDEESLDGKVTDESSKYRGKTMAPVMINFQIKCALATMWRTLQKDILEELSTLYSSVYNGEKLKNWPTIFLLAAILLAVWEEMQFDCHYRVPVSARISPAFPSFPVLLFFPTVP